MRNQWLQQHHSGASWCVCVVMLKHKCSLSTVVSARAFFLNHLPRLLVYIYCFWNSYCPCQSHVSKSRGNTLMVVFLIVSFRKSFHIAAPDLALLLRLLLSPMAAPAAASVHRRKCALAQASPHVPTLWRRQGVREGGTVDISIGQRRDCIWVVIMADDI